MPSFRKISDCTLRARCGETLSEHGGAGNELRRARIIFHLMKTSHVSARAIAARSVLEHPDSCLGGTCERPASQFDAQLANTTELAERLEKLAQAFANRLAPVSRPLPPQATNDKATPEAALVPIADRIRSINRRLAVHVQNLEEVLQAVEC